MDYISVAIDGPAGAGKSTIAKQCASKLNYVYVDTGAMYRAITYKALKLNIDINDESQYTFIDNTDIQLTKDDRVLIDGEDVTRQIRERDVTNAVSIVSSQKVVREKIVPMQRVMALKSDIIMDGRDIGTNVLKDATVKIYLTASVEERAKRRYNELIAKNPTASINYEEIKSDIINRDYLDTTRELNPLVKASDAIEVDSSLLTIDEVVDTIIGIILGKVNSKMEQTINYNFKNFRVGQIIEGEVIKVTENEVLVNFGDFTEGTMYLNELTLKEVESAKDFVSVGDVIKAKIKKRDDEVVLLSRLDIEREENHRKLLNKFEHKNVISAKVVKEVKGGFIVKIYGIDCFMPASEVDVDSQFDTQSLINETIKVKIIEVSKGFKNRDNIVVSRKTVIAAELFKEKLNKFKAIEVDAIYQAEVVRVESYGVLVIANDYQGLVPYREISHLPFANITDVLNVGDKVNVKVTAKNDDKLQVLFSIKALLPKPWEVASQNINEGDVIEGKIARITDFGAFVNVYPLVDGLLHRNEYTYNPFVDMFNEIKEGQTITVKVISIDTNKERLSLSVKQLKEDPWLTCGLKPYEIVEMTVIGFDNGDALVQYAEDVVGILPKNQVSSEKKITKAEDELTVGQTVSVKVTNFNANDRYLQVSIRKIKEDAERQDFVKYMKEQDSVKNNTIGDLLGDKLKDFLK